MHKIHFATYACIKCDFIAPNLNKKLIKGIKLLEDVGENSSSQMQQRLSSSAFQVAVMFPAQDTEDKKIL